MSVLDTVFPLPVPAATGVKCSDCGRTAQALIVGSGERLLWARKQTLVSVSFGQRLPVATGSNRQLSAPNVK
jgi:hypothetical protein